MLTKTTLASKEARLLLGGAMIGALFVWAVALSLGIVSGPVLVLHSLDWSLFLTLCIVVPILEELVFRGMLQGYLRQFDRGQKAILGISAANLLTSLLFMSLHWLNRDGYSALLVFLPSLYLGLVRDRTSSIPMCILIHILWNLGWYIFVFMS
ncbi:MAG TPA: JDVT-CTERM system CAAX-type protease [Gammaproteobacteria bacterium]|nr:JDVT-CTERM system CAAX-type protease [Gammaproteobacteria bacterium]HIK68501.1 JDVT-CTERM system CAAX-type protease [Pseudomonadales bacterium]